MKKFIYFSGFLLGIGLFCSQGDLSAQGGTIDLLKNDFFIEDYGLSQSHVIDLRGSTFVLGPNTFTLADKGSTVTIKNGVLDCTLAALNTDATIIFQDVVCCSRDKTMPVVWRLKDVKIVGQCTFSDFFVFICDGFVTVQDNACLCLDSEYSIVFGSESKVQPLLQAIASGKTLNSKLLAQYNFFGAQTSLPETTGRKNSFKNKSKIVGAILAANCLFFGVLYLMHNY